MRGESINDLIDELERDYPGLKERLTTKAGSRRFITST